MIFQILIAVFASLLAIALYPLLKKLGIFMVKSISHFNLKYRNSIYKAASIRNKMEVPLLNLYFLMLIIIWGIVISLFVVNFYAERTSFNTTLLINKISKQTNPNIELSINKDNLLSLQKAKEGLQNNIKNIYSLKILAIATAVILVFILFLLYSRVQLINSLILEFEYSIQLLSLKLKKEDVLELNYLWAKMKEKEDYDLIIKKLAEIAKSQENTTPDSRV